jgi:uncharacterized protein (DUF1800 family)
MAIAASRFGLGAGPQDDPGSDAKAWLKAQLQGPDPGLASGKFASLPTGGEAEDNYYQIIQQIKAFMAANPNQPSTQLLQPLGVAMRADMAAQLWFAATTPYSFRERLVWFWANHFSASVQSNAAGPFIGPMLREAIRPHVTGKFTDMVLAAESHPAMLRSLNNYNSFGPNSPVGLRTGRGLNENLGRECMELHTVSLAAGYTQTDVTNMAKILTGWSIALQSQGADSTGFKYNPNIHEPGPQTVMGHSFDGGQQAGIDALTFLSTYPTTYDFLARKLVIHFVADDPPPAAVAQIAGVLRDTQGDLGAASAALVDLPQAWVPGQKFKTPFEYTISMVRAAPPPPSPKPPLLQAVLNQLGQPVWSAPLPNGWPDQAADWAGSDAVMARIDFAYTYAGRFGDATTSPLQLADNALGPLLRPETRAAMSAAGSPREAMTLFLTAPEFQRR